MALNFQYDSILRIWRVISIFHIFKERMVKFVCIYAWMLKYKKIYVSIMGQANKLLLVCDFKYKVSNE